MHASPTNGRFDAVWNASNPLHADYRGPARPSQIVGGQNGEPMQLTNVRTIKHCRMSANAPAVIRSVQPAGVTGGYVEGATRAKDCKVWGRKDVLAMRKTTAPKPKTGRGARKRARIAAARNAA